MSIPCGIYTVSNSHCFLFIASHNFQLPRKRTMFPKPERCKLQYFRLNLWTGREIYLLWHCFEIAKYLRVESSMPISCSCPHERSVECTLITRQSVNELYGRSPAWTISLTFSVFVIFVRFTQFPLSYHARTRNLQDSWWTYIPIGIPT